MRDIINYESLKFTSFVLLLGYNKIIGDERNEK